MALRLYAAQTTNPMLKINGYFWLLVHIGPTSLLCGHFNHAHLGPEPHRFHYMHDFSILKHFTMQSPSVWIELRSGAPGLDGPFLQEFRSPYQLFRASNWRKPRVITVIGGKVKRQHFTDCYLKPPVEEELGKICLRQHRTQEILFIDCEMHTNSKISRLMGGPCPGHYHIHRIENAPPTISAISDRIYLEVIAPLSHAVLLFTDDFGGFEHTIEFLISWIYRAMAMPGIPRLHVHLILGNKNHGLTNTLVWFEISTGLLAQINARDPTKTYSLRSIMEIGHRYLQCDLQYRFTEETFSKMAHGPAQTDAREAYQSPYIYHKALTHFAKSSPKPFNIAIAYADKTPLPEMWEGHITDLIQSCQNQQVSPTPLLSSIFAFHAFPEGTQCE